MAFSQLLIQWILISVYALAISTIEQNKLNIGNLGLATLVATVTIGITLLWPLAQSPGLLGATMSWSCHFLVYTSLTATVSKTPLKKCALRGVVFATLSTITNASC